MTEQELIQAFQDGEAEAGARLLSRYEKSLYGYLLHTLGNAPDAEDALQETLVKAFQGLGRYREEGNFRGWLFSIAHREAINALRRRSQIASREQTTDAIPDRGVEMPYGSDALQEQERFSELERSILELPPAEREVVWLRLKSDLPFKEIARITGSPLNTVLGRMRNATIRLRKMLQEARI